MEDPNYEQTDIFAFMKGRSEGKRKKVRTKKAALAAGQKRGKSAREEASLFGEEMTAEKKPARAKKASAQKAAPSAKAVPQPKEVEGKVSEPQRGSWREKLWEFDITHPSQDIKDRMKEALVA